MHSRRAARPPVSRPSAWEAATRSPSRSSAWDNLRGRAGAAIAAILGFYAVSVLVAEALGFVLPASLGPGQEGLLAAGSLRLAAGAMVAGAIWAFTGWCPWWAQGWPAPGRSAGVFARGLGIGLAMASAVIAIEVVTGTVAFNGTGESLGDYARAAATLVGFLAIAALAEELLFRGFPLARLTSAIGRWPAVLTLTVGFTALHLPNPGVSPLGLANIAVASVVLSAAFFEWGGIPAAWGLHLGWNAGLGAGADTPVSGIPFDMPGFDYASTGPDWITGGPFGPEGGIVATVVMGIAAVFLWKPFIRRPARQEKA